MRKSRIALTGFCLFASFFLLTSRPATTSTVEAAQVTAFDSLVASYGGTYVQVSWDHDAATQPRGYNIYRYTISTGLWEKLNQEPFLQFVFVDPSAPIDSFLLYRVTAIGVNDTESDVGPAVQVRTDTPSESLASPLVTQAYDKNNIITDSQLTNAAAMTQTQIQSFLSSQGSVLANYSTGGKTAAQHIFDACQTHGISPCVVLVTLQKEKGLVRSGTANPNSFAMGWNTVDSSTSDFANQIFYGTRQFRRYYDNLGFYGWTVGQSHSVSDGTITAANLATAGLYVYTPWIGQGGGGQPNVGGNYLYWDLWYNTFGFPSATATLPTSVLAPVVGPLRVTSSNLGIADGKWEFDQHRAGAHGPNGGIGGSDDTFAWDANWYKVDDHNADVGQNVYATADGDVVLYAGVGLGNSCNAVLIAHPTKTAPQWWSGYLHLAQYNVTLNQHVTQNTVIGTVGRACADNDHLHFVVYGGQNVSGGLVSFNAGINERTNACASGSSESYRASGNRPPLHPNGTLVKASGDPTVYLIRDGQKRGITSAAVLSNLYQQSNSDFSNDVITVAADELNRYSTGVNVSGSFPSNGRSQPDGRLIRQSGGTEVSIVTDIGHRRPFATQQAFLGLGYQFCKVIDVVDYSSYPQGPLVEAMPIITGSISVSPSGPYSVGQTIGGTFSLSNIGTAAVTFAAVTIGGRLNSTVTDFPFHTNVTINPGQTVSYQDTFTFFSAGSYSFFPAYQTQDSVWRIGLNHEIPTDPAITDLLILNVGSCSYSVSPPSASFSSSGGAGSFTVTTQSGCGWLASSDVAWISSSSTGTGSGTANYSVAQNSSTSSRTGHVTVQGQTHTVTQSGISCSYSVSPPSASYVSSGGSGSFAVTTQTGCGWSASSDVAWITTSSSGAGSGTVNYSVSANSSASSRTGHVTVQGQAHTVTQSGIACTYSVSPPSASFSSIGGSGSFGVTTQAGCGWSASSDVGWITTSSNGAGSGTVSYSVVQNSSTSSRTGHVSVQGQVHTVNQAGGASLQPDLIVTSLSAPAGGSPGGQITVSMTVRNQGAIDAGSFRVAFYFSTDSTITTGDLFTGWFCDFPQGLAAGASTSCGGPIGVPVSLASGSYYFGAIVDDLGSVAESNEANNARPADTGPISLTDTGGETLLLSETFSGGMPPTWSAIDGGTGGGASSTWTTASPCGEAIDSPFSGPFAMIHSDCAGPDATQDEQLITPVINAAGCGQVILEFTNQFHWYNLGLAEIADVDVSTDGGSSWMNVARMQGANDGYPTPNTKSLNITSAIGSNRSTVRIRFHYYAASFEWWWAIDNVKVRCISQPHNTKSDLDGDGKSDIGYYRDGVWGFLQSSQNYSYCCPRFFSWGGAGSPPIVADFDGDGRADLAYIAPPSGGQSAAYAILKSTANYDFNQALFVAAGFPSLGDTPVVGDFDGDGKADPGIWRSSQGVWIIPRSSTNYSSSIFTQWGQTGDTPIVADLDGDGKSDIGYYRNGVWGFLLSSQNYSYCCPRFFSWGGAGLQPIVADFDGDGRADLAYVVPPSGGQSAAYAILKSTANYDFNQALFVAAGFPSLGDTPVVGDFDGDGKADPGIWRSSQGVWIIPRSSTNYSSSIFIQWGQPGDTQLTHMLNLQ